MEIMKETESAVQGQERKADLPAALPEARPESRLAGRIRREQMRIQGEGGGRPSSVRATAAKLLAWFFAFILLFTLVSRAADGMTVAQVDTAGVKGTELKHGFEKDGKITASGEQALNAMAGLKIAEVMVKEGDAVKEGDPLVRFDTSKAEWRVRELLNELSALQVKISNLQAGGDEDEAQIEEAQRKLDLAREDFIRARDQADTMVIRAQDDYEKALDEYRELRANWEDLNEDMADAYDDAVMDLNDLLADYSEEMRQVKKETAAALSALKAAESSGDPDRVAEAKKRYADALEQERTKDKEWEAPLAVARDKVSQARQNWDNDTSDDSALKSAREVVEQRSRAQEDAENSKDSAILNAQRAIEEAERGVEDAKKKIEKAKEEEERKQGENAVSAGGYQIEAGQKQETLQQLREVIQGGGVLAAPSDGAVSALNAQVGDETSGRPLLTLASREEGWVFETDVSRKEAELIAVGDEVSLNIRSGGTERGYKGTVLEIGQEDDKQMRKVKIALPEGSGNLGDTGSMEVEKKTKRYTTTLPLEALRSDNGGDFIYVIREKDTVLGKETVAERVMIEVLDKDTSNMAVEGAFQDGDKIITSSNKPISDGDRVRVNGG